MPTHYTKKWSFPLRISSVNVTKSTVIPDLWNPAYFVRFNEETLMENFIFCEVIFWSLCLVLFFFYLSINLYVKRRKCQLRVTYTIFSSLQFLFFIFAEILVCATVFIIFFSAWLFPAWGFKTKNPERCFLLVVINVTGSVSTLWRVIFFGWNKAAEKRLTENKNSREILISTKNDIKYNIKVGKLEKTSPEC